MTPGDGLNQPGKEYILGAQTLEQGRLCFRMVREALEPRGGYRFLDSTTKIGITHLPTNTRLRVMSSNARAAFGFVGIGILVLDEPGALDVVGGSLLADAIDTSLGKPDSDLTVVYVGTLAPASSGWWHDLIERGTHGKTYVQSIQGRPDRWDSPHEIKRCNPLAWYFPESRAQLLSERDEARGDPRLKARFMSYRLNLPTADESQTLLTVDDWKLATSRTSPALPEGRPIVAVDLGGGRAWSAAVAIWQSGRVDAIALAPGIPDLAEQERRDTAPSGVYRALYEKGLLRVADGLRVQPPAMLWEFLVSRWGCPASVVCDRFRLGELMDAVRGACRVEGRVTRWSEASQDIRALRKIVRDGPLTVNPEARLLFAASLMVAVVKSDDAGSSRLVKRDSNNRARDDVAAALLLVAGAFDRATVAPPRALSYAVL